MGTGKRWSVEERVHLTEAWIDATEDAGEEEVKGTYQDSDVFWKRVYDKYVAKAPKGHPKGSYSGRQASAVQNQWKDKLARDVKKFNKALLRVFSAKPTGCSEQNQINMAVAIHLGKTSTMSYVHKEFEANDWEFYQCWNILKTHRAFLPPSTPTEENTIEMEGDEEDDEEESEEVLDRSSPSNSESGVESNSTNNTKAAFTTPKRARSRGPGPGAKKTKMLASADEYRKKKTKIQEGFLEVQKQRQNDFKAFVKNHARNKAFEMAALGYKTFKDSDPHEAAKYKAHMSNILRGNTDGDDNSDSDDDMPALDGNNSTGV